VRWKSVGAAQQQSLLNNSLFKWPIPVCRSTNTAGADDASFSLSNRIHGNAFGLLQGSALNIRNYIAKRLSRLKQCRLVGSQQA
jgi:uncharacterized protein with beta-barrel porin domain